MKIRKMARADLPALAKLNAKIFSDTTSTGKQALIALRHSFENKVGGACLVAEEGGKLLGAVFGVKKITFYPNCAYVASFFVAKSHRGKGVGKALFAACMKAMKKKGVKSVSLTVDEKNKRTLKLYKKAGFKPFRLMLLRRF